MAEERDQRTFVRHAGHRIWAVLARRGDADQLGYEILAVEKNPARRPRGPFPLVEPMPRPRMR